VEDGLGLDTSNMYPSVERWEKCCAVSEVPSLQEKVAVENCRRATGCWSDYGSALYSSQPSRTIKDLLRSSSPPHRIEQKGDVWVSGRTVAHERSALREQEAESRVEDGVKRIARVIRGFQAIEDM
jgi:hypothetical protein